MKNKLVCMLTACMLTAGLSVHAAAAQPSIEQVFRSVSALLKKDSTDACKKANFFGGVFSLRSFKGKLCNFKPVAMLATAVCKSTPDFAESQCGINAAEVLKANPPTEAEKDKVIEVVKKQAGDKAAEKVADQLDKL